MRTLIVQALLIHIILQWVLVNHWLTIIDKSPCDLQLIFTEIRSAVPTSALIVNSALLPARTMVSLLCPHWHAILHIHVSQAYMCAYPGICMHQFDGFNSTRTKPTCLMLMFAFVCESTYVQEFLCVSGIREHSAEGVEGWWWPARCWHEQGYLHTIAPMQCFTHTNRFSGKS